MNVIERSPCVGICSNQKTEDKNTESEFDVDALLATPAVMQRLMSVLMQRISVAQ